MNCQWTNVTNAEKAGQKINWRRRILRFSLLMLALPPFLGLSGCMTDTEHKRLLNEAVQEEQQKWSARVNELHKENQRQRAEHDAELARVRIEADNRTLQLSIRNLKNGHEGKPIEIDESISTPTSLVLSIFWLSIVTCLGALGVLCLWLIRDSVGRKQLIKILMVPVSVYVVMRLAPPLTDRVFSLFVTHEAAAEVVLLIVGLVGALLVGAYYKAEHRLGIDLAGIFACVSLMIGFSNLFLINNPLWLASGPTLGLKLAISAPVGATAFAIVRAVRNSAEPRRIELKPHSELFGSLLHKI